jgi:dipeptidyl-peptidase-4
MIMAKILFNFFRTAVLLLILAASIDLQAQMMFRDESKPRVTGWVDDTHFIFQTFDKDKKPVYQNIDVKSGKSEAYTPGKTDREKITSALPSGTRLGMTDQISPDGKKALISKANDIYCFTLGDTSLVRLTRDSIPKMNARFSPDGKKIAYTKNKDLFVFDLLAQKEKRLTFDATEKVYNGWSSWVYMEEILGRPSNYAAFWWSPDGTKLAYFRFDDTPVPVFTLNRLDNTDGIHGKLEVTPYPKPGDPNPKVRVKVVDVTSLRTTTIKTDAETDQYFGWPFWTPDSKKIAVQVLNRDQNDMRFILADTFSGEYTEIYKETGKSWVEFYEDIYVMKNGSGYIVRSYRNNWENLYYYGWDGQLKKQLTDFNWRVNSIDMVDEAAGYVYFTGTGPEATDSHVFRVSLDGTNLLQITHGDGAHKVLISPKGKYFLDTWNNINSAGSIIATDEKGKVIREIHKFEQPVFDASKHAKNELVKIPTSDGLFQMPVIITYPLNFDETKKYPVVFTIYGGPNSGTVFNTWKGTTASWYAENGIIAINADHRGSGKFGKTGWDYMYRNLGKWEISDYSDVVKWLRNKPYADPGRMGITGSSYGGYVTCMALTKGADTWTHGIASSSVTDWNLYDDVYTERFMDTPEDNPEGYKAGSALQYAGDFKGKLLITHGDMDDNVHMQNSIWLISKLEDAGKSFEFMLYPNGRHGWGGAKRKHSTDEAHRFWLKYFFGKN